MLDKNILKQSLTFAALAAAYITVVATVMQNAEHILGPGEDTALAPIVFLLLFVVSAATMGMLIFGKPVMLYIDGKKRDAVTMVMYTIGVLAVITFALLLGLLAGRG